MGVCSAKSHHLFLLIKCTDSVKLSGATTESATSATGSESTAGQNLIVDDVAGLLGVLHGLRNLVPLMCDASLTAVDTAFQLKGSFGAKVTETDTHIDIVLVLRVNFFSFHFVLFYITSNTVNFACNALTLLVMHQKGHSTCTKSPAPAVPVNLPRCKLRKSAF